MKNVNIINDVEREFLSSLTNQSVMCGSIFTRLEVAEIIKAFTTKLKESVIEDTPTQSVVSEAKIQEIGRLAYDYAQTYVGNCVDNYDFDGACELESDDYGNEIRVSASVNIDDADLMSAGDFNLDKFQDELTEIINRQDEQN